MTEISKRFRFFPKKCGKYRSKFEAGIAAGLIEVFGKDFYEPHALTYVEPESTHKYTPDFVLPNGIHIEAKGVFDAEDRKKLLHVRESNPTIDLRLLFMRCLSPITKGSKTTYADWCRKHGFKFAEKEIPEGWLRKR